MTKKLKITLLIFAVSFTVLTSASPALAKNCNELTTEAKDSWLSNIIPGGLLIPCVCLSSEPSESVRCGLNEAFQTIVNFSQILLAVTGSAALLVFAVGGVMFVISAGNEEMIKKGKDAMKNAAIGIVIILGAWLIVNFTIFALTGGDIGNVKIFGNTPWSQKPSGATEGNTPIDKSSGCYQNCYFMTPYDQEAIDQCVKDDC